MFQVDGQLRAAGVVVKMSDQCCVCQSNEARPSLAFVRGFNLGRHFEEGDPDQRKEMLLRSLCLRHCHELNEHEAWVLRNQGKDLPWPEEEPRVT